VSGKLRWHFIGHLQSNKCRDAVELFEMIQSVDSLALAQELNKRADQAAKTMPILLEVNVAAKAASLVTRRDGCWRNSRAERIAPVGNSWPDVRAPWNSEPEKSDATFGVCAS